MGTLQGPALEDFVKHVLQCDACQDSVYRMDCFRDAIWGAASHLQDREGSASEVTKRFNVEYLVVQAALPGTKIENIGILLLDVQSDRLYCRFRRDFEEFAGYEADWFEQLPAGISKQADVLGAQKCLEWMESTFSNAVRLSPRRVALIEDYARALNSLYSTHIRPNVLRFRTHLPQYSLEASAGTFGKQMTVEAEGWVELRTERPLTDAMFVTHVKGHSMEPLIPHSSLCVFQSGVLGSWDGKVLLVERYGESGGNRYTIKLCRCSQDVDSSQSGENAGLPQSVTLESLNPAYRPWDVAPGDKIRALGEFLFVVCN
ncbi:MAG TPA: hypothetical protein DEV93_07750 [Chloroflexi bacterium]|nr:hypothetical protein [Chloroflexota bacterium]